MLTFISTAFNNEPVAIVNAIRLVCLAAMTFGLHLSPVQLGASMIALEAVLTLFTRSQVNSAASTAKAIGIALESNPGKGQVVNVAEQAAVSVPATGTGSGTPSGGLGTGTGTGDGK